MRRSQRHVYSRQHYGAKGHNRAEPNPEEKHLFILWRCQKKLRQTMAVSGIRSTLSKEHNRSQIETLDTHIYAYKGRDQLFVYCILSHGFQWGVYGVDGCGVYI